MAERTGYPDGAPCWVELATPDAAAVSGFYAGLFGWTCQDQGEEFGHYTMCSLDGRAVAAISPAQGAPPAGAPSSYWSVYLATSDVDAGAATVEANGGKLLAPPMDVPGFGRFAYATDPTGAAFGLWQAGPFSGAQLHDEPGALCWSEVTTTDGAAADTFYRALFGYEQEQTGDGAAFDYTVWRIGGTEVCGRLQMDENWAGIAPHWMAYFAVPDCDAAVRRVTELGGALGYGPFDTPHGRMAVVSDPAGAHFTLCRRPG
ncbi:VOC family protein [Streptosporangium fragile]|uniref:VOC family protein n=1 Tax=Streptosporangium fragile TaxID=46186 RepID=A0ABP6I837_9ACTN